MKENENIILSAIGDIDDRFIRDAKPRGRGRQTIFYRTATVAAVLLILVVSVIVPFVLNGSGEYNQNLQFLSAIKDFMFDSVSGGIDIDVGGSPGIGTPEGGAPNGDYFEVTDNQVEGIVEGDLVKATDKYLFRLGNHTIYIYSIGGADSRLVSTYTIPYLSGEQSYSPKYHDMFLSSDGKTLTLFAHYTSNTDLFYFGTTVVMSIDVSDVTAPKEISRAVVGGAKNCVRKIGDKFYLVTNMMFKKNRIDLDDPITYIPSIDYGDKTHICDSSKIVFPEKISNVYYSYVTILNEGDLSLNDEAALMTSGNVYFTENNIIFESSYSSKITEGDKSVERLFTRFGVLNMSDGLTGRGYFTVKGEIKDQYSIDERDGVLRIVASTSDNVGYSITYDSTSLYIYDLKTLKEISSVESFAPKGEAATAVRFEGDKLYVCTAEITTYSDPVFFFDLSDYNNITYADTGFIEGFSTSLIDFGEGYLLGVGLENGSQNKLEVYRREGDQVVSVDKFYFSGRITTDYKSFLINREENLFGLYVANYSTQYTEKANSYVVVRLDENGKLEEVCRINTSAESNARAFAKDGYIYLTSKNDFYVSGTDGKLLYSVSTEHKLGEWTYIKGESCGEAAILEATCTCGRSQTKTEYNSNRILHTFSDEGVCTNCGSDIGSPKNNADKIIYTSNGDGTCAVTGVKGWIYGVVNIPMFSPKGEIVTKIGETAFGSNGMNTVILPDTVKVIEANAFIESTLKEINTNKVREIGDYAFYACKDLTTVTFSKSLEKIGDNAFSYCESLTSVDIPDSVTEIGESAFSFCENMTSVRLSKGLTQLNRAVFNNCRALQSINLPDGLTSIGEFAFNMCYELSEVVIPDGVTKIEKRAFADCRSLALVTLGSGVVEIASDAFSECCGIINITNRSSLTLTIGSDDHGGIAKYAQYIGEEASLVKIDGYVFLMLTDRNYLLGYEGSETALVLPSDVNGEDYDISYGAFENRKGIVSVVVPDGVKEIGDRAFYGCTDIVEMVLPDSVERIGEYAFGHCKFTSIALPSGLTEIDDAVFWHCSNLYYIDIPEGVDRIGEKAFNGCFRMTAVSIPATVKEIGNEAFSGCKALLSVELPEGITCIGYNTFNNCQNMHTVVIPSTVTQIDNAFYGCYSLKNVNFRGTKAEWHSMTRDYNNGIWGDVTINYNAK